MTDSFQTLFTTSDVPAVVTWLLVLTAIIYICGWAHIRRTRKYQFPFWRLICFLGGIGSLFVAVASPLDTFGASLLIMHMGQHFIFMSVAPPLILLGAPVVPLLRGLPSGIVRTLLGPIFRCSSIRQLGKFLVRPEVAWIAMNLSFIAWHIPRSYEFALRTEFWHNVEHSCFFATSILFWWPVIQPWPSRPLAARWVLVPYLVLADIVNTGISAFLCFAGRLLYPSYGAIQRPFGFSALNDQSAAGAFMWVAGSIVFLIPAVAITAQLLSGSRERNEMQAGWRASPISH